MKKYITITLMLIGILSFGQTAVKKSSISTGGGSATIGNTTVTSAIGEVAVQEATQGNAAVSEGFIGPNIINALGIQDYGQLQDIQVFPNPVKDVFQVQVPASQTYEYRLFDINGKQLFFRNSNNETEQFDIGNLRRATYLLLIIDPVKHKKKIVKLQKE